jgi:hypothetical protein
MKEIMYDINTAVIAGGLFVSLALAIEIGFRIGARFKESADEASKAQVAIIQTSLLGILALLLGFTFSLSLQRYDRRNEAVVAEANAIGTAYLRAQLLPASVRSNVQKLLRDYLEQRIQAGSITLANQTAREALLAQSTRTQSALWGYARQAADDDPSPVKSGLFIQSLNDLIDNFGNRDAVLNRHVPEVVLMLLFGTFLMAGVIVGYASGIAGHRASFVTYIMVSLIVVLVFIILDLDRPRRGLIEVDHKSLFDLQTAINTDTQADAQQSNRGGAPRSVGARHR